MERYFKIKVWRTERFRNFGGGKINFLYGGGTFLIRVVDQMSQSGLSLRWFGRLVWGTRLDFGVIVGWGNNL